MPAINVNILLFPNYCTLDAFGPAQILARLEGAQIRFASVTGGPMKNDLGLFTASQSLDAVVDAADRESIWVVPGGQGTRELVGVKPFLEAIGTIARTAKFCLSVCTGAALLAKAGVLDGKKATTNRKAFDWVASQSDSVQWVRDARWVRDGKFYTSAGVAAGMDMALGFVSDQYGRDVAEAIARHLEYVWNDDPAAGLFV